MARLIVNLLVETKCSQLITDGQVRIVGETDFETGERGIEIMRTISMETYGR